MAEAADVIVCWNHGPVPNEVRGAFERPTRILNLGSPAKFRDQVRSLGWPFPLKNALANRLPDVRPLRVGLLGFSASCMGVSEFLRSKDAGLFDSVVCIDGIHPSTDRSELIRGAFLGPFISFGRIAAFGPALDSSIPRGSKLLAISNSQANGPPGYEATRVASEEIVAGVLSAMPYVTSDAPSGLFSPAKRHPWVNPEGQATWGDGGSTHWKESRFDRPTLDWYVRVDNFLVASYTKNDPTSIGDHRYQAAVVLPSMLEYFVAPRWNALDPADGTCTLV